MPAPKGNKFAVGNRGGGRKSAYVEKADADLLWDMFTKPMRLEEVKARLDSGCYSLLDVIVSKAYEGNERILCMFMAKLFPDRERYIAVRPRIVEIVHHRAGRST
jgi:hypothetical protein